MSVFIRAAYMHVADKTHTHCIAVHRGNMLGSDPVSIFFSSLRFIAKISKSAFERGAVRRCAFQRRMTTRSE